MTAGKQIKKVDNFISVYGEISVLLLTAIIIFTPAFKISDKLPAIRIEEILLPFMLLVVIFKTKCLISLIKRPVNIIFIGLTISFAISTIYSMTVLGRGLSLSDIMEFVRIAKYIILYNYTFTVIKDVNTMMQKHAKFIDIAVIALLFFNVFQYFNLLNINNWLTHLYSPPWHLESIARNRRIVGTFGNPNYFGALMMFFVLYYFNKTLFNWESFTKRTIFNIGLIIMATTSLLMTISRTAIIVTLGGMGVSIIWYLWLHKKFSINIIKITAIFLVVFVMSNFLIIASNSLHENITTYKDSLIRNSNDSSEDNSVANNNGDGQPQQSDTTRKPNNTHTVGYRMKEAMNENRSMMMRLEVWQEQFLIALESPVIGFGPQKDEYRDFAMDNEFLLILQRYGVIGLMFYLALYLSAIFKKLKTEKYYWYYSFFVSITAALLVFNLLAGSFYHLQLFPVYIIFMAILDNIHFTEKVSS